MTLTLAQEKQLQTANHLLQSGRIVEATGLLETLIAAFPRVAPARGLLGSALRLSGDISGAEVQFRAALQLDATSPDLFIALANLLADTDRPQDAEVAFRRAWTLAPTDSRAASGLADAMILNGRPVDALNLTTPLIDAPAKPTHDLLATHAQALKALGRLEEARDVYARAVHAFPKSGVAEHNLAAVLGDLARHSQAEAGARRAFRLGVDAAQTWLVLARALQGQGKLLEAEQAYGQVLKRNPFDVDGHRGLAQLLWMNSGDVALATKALDDALLQHLGSAPLIELKAVVLRSVGRSEEAYTLLTNTIRREPGRISLLTAAARLSASVGKAADGLRFAEEAASLAPHNPAVQLALCETLLTAGEASRAAELAAGVLQTSPENQAALAYLGMAWRMQGDDRRTAQDDYASLVRTYTLAVPDGWPTLEDYLHDLQADLIERHFYRSHPFQQSVEYGSQIFDLDLTASPALRGVQQALDGPIRRYLEDIGHGADPLRRRNVGDYEFQGLWSIKLEPGGRHISHIHPRGWISSACYISLPEGMEASEDKQGWLAFGEPGMLTKQKLEPEYFVQPTPGLLALFPSYMWHKTMPFTGPGHRLTVAFDLLPRRP